MKQVVQQLVKIHNHILIYTIILQVEMLKFRFLYHLKHMHYIKYHFHRIK